MRITIASSVILTASMALFLSGCGSAPNESADPTADEAHMDHGDHGVSAGGQSDMDKMKAELAKLTAEDATSAGKQHMCPVSGEMLGTMGAPKKIDVNGQQVWICCDGCKDKLLADPDKFLVKLKQD